MENLHKHSAFAHSCITRPRLPRQTSNPRSHQRRRSRSSGHHDWSSDPRLLLLSPPPSTGQGDSAGGRELGRKMLMGSTAYRCGGGGGSSEIEDDDDVDEEDDDLFKLKTNVLSDLEKENLRFRSMSDFYDSIPGTSAGEAAAVLNDHI